MSKDDKLADTLGIEPLEVLPPQTTNISVNDDSDRFDMETARENLHHIIQKGSDALDEMIMIAKQSESARAFEVVSTLIKTLSETNKDLVDLAKKKKEIFSEEQQGPNTVNNNLFVGSTADLQRMLKELNDDQ